MVPFLMIFLGDFLMTIYTLGDFLMTIYTLFLISPSFLKDLIDTLKPPYLFI